MNRRIVLPVVAVPAIFAVCLIWVNGYLAKPLNIFGDEYVLDVVKGSSLKAVARQLTAAGVLEHPRVFELVGRVAGKAERIQAGEYALSHDTTPGSLMDQLIDGQVKLHSLTVVEGWTVSKLLEAIRHHPAVRQTLEIKAPIDLVDSLQFDYPHPEGLFFPETYRFPRGTTDAELLRRAHDLMRERLAEAWAGRQPGLILTDPYEVLIMASIVERESALERERPAVAGVFMRRLEQGMRLQTDPTVIYGLGPAFDGNLTRRHLAEDTPYNTYVRKGLPPTPIALPSESSLRATVNPSPGDALYFVATGKEDGSHYFTATLEEHNAAVERYLTFMKMERKK